MDIRKGKLLKDGNTKRIFSTNREDVLILSFKDIIMLGDKKETIKGKNIGKYANSISSQVFRFLENYHIPTHFVESSKPGEMSIRNLAMVPISICVWNCASGSLCKRFGFEKGKTFDFPIIELYLKNELLHHPMIHYDHALAMGLIQQHHVQELDRLVRKINAVLKDFFARRNLKMADLSLEFGYLKDEIVLGDEITPKTFHLLDMQQNGALDFNRFQTGRRDPKEIMEELYNRIALH